MRDAWLGPYERDLYFDRAGQPITLEEWGRLREDLAYKVLAQTEVGDAWVSTVWLGIDHGFALEEEAPPIIFETMVFGGQLDQTQERYATEAQAWEGHAVMCQFAAAAQRVRVTSTRDDEPRELES